MTTEPFQPITDKPAKKRGNGKGIAAGAALLAVSVIGSAIAQPTTQAPSTAPTAQAQPAPAQSAPTAAPDAPRVRMLTGERLVVTRAIVACQSADDHARLLQMAATDRQGAERRLDTMIARGDCATFPAGAAIIIEEWRSGWITSTACIRILGRGDPCMWTDRDIARTRVRLP